MNTNAAIDSLEILIDELKGSESQLDRARISQTIKFTLDGLLETANRSAENETDSNKINTNIPISEIATSLFVISNYDVVDGRVFSSHFDFLHQSVQKLR